VTDFEVQIALVTDETELKRFEAAKASLQERVTAGETEIKE